MIRDKDGLTTWVSQEEVEKGIRIDEMFVFTGLCSSRSEFRRLVEAGGAYFNNKRIVWRKNDKG